MKRVYPQKNYIVFLGLFLLLSLIRWEYRYHFSNFYLDQELQTVAAASLLRYGRPVLPTVHYSAPNQVIQKPLTVFPPGYAEIQAFLIRSGLSYLAAYRLLDFIALAILLFTSCLILYACNVHISVWILFGLYWAWSPGLLHPLPSPDLLCLALFTLSISAWVYAGDPGIKGKSYLLLSSLALFSLPFIRYAYLPLVCIPPLLAWGQYGFERGRKNITSAAVLSLFAFLAVLPFIYRFATRFNLPYVEHLSTGFFPAHLLRMDPYPFKTFLYFGHLTIDGIEKAGNVLVPTIQALAWGVSLFIIWRLYTAGNEVIEALKNKRIISPWMKVIGIACVTIGVNTLVIAAMSLRTAPETDWRDHWTFVMETRYFAPAQWAVLISVLLIINRTQAANRLFWVRTMVIGVILSAVFPFYIRYRYYALGEKGANSLPDKKFERMQQLDAAYPTVGLYVSNSSFLPSVLNKQYATFSPDSLKLLKTGTVMAILNENEYRDTAIIRKLAQLHFHHLPSYSLPSWQVFLRDFVPENAEGSVSPIHGPPR